MIPNFYPVSSQGISILYFVGNSNNIIKRYKQWGLDFYVENPHTNYRDKKSRGVKLLI